MERLTDNFRGMGNCGITKHAMTSDGKANLSRFADKIITKLADYEDAEEQGLLLRLPCKVGTELFAVIDKCRAMIVSEEDCDDESSCLECPYKKQFIVTQVSATKDVLTDEYFSKVPTYMWGKTLFATKEEAEQALKRMESE